MYYFSVLVIEIIDCLGSWNRSFYFIRRFVIFCALKEIKETAYSNNFQI